MFLVFFLNSESLEKILGAFPRLRMNYSWQEMDECFQFIVYE